jgi:hypothetical protein
MSSDIDHDRRRLLLTALVYAAVSQLGSVGCAVAQTAASIRLPVEGELPSLARIIHEV